MIATRLNGYLNKGDNMERITGNLDISEIKHFQMPETIIDIECPECGDVRGIQLVDHLYYPSEGNNTVSCDCDKCGATIERNIDIISVIVTMDVHDPEIV